MVWRVFNEYEAVNYPPSGTQAFRTAIHDEGFLGQLSAYGAFEDDRLIGEFDRFDSILLLQRMRDWKYNRYAERFWRSAGRRSFPS